MGRKKKFRQKRLQSPDDISDDDTIPVQLNEIEINNFYKDEKLDVKRTDIHSVDLNNKAATKERTFLQDKVKNSNQKNKATTKVKGFSNLGNTCFFNAVMQNLVQSPWLYEWLKEHSSKEFIWKLAPPPITINSENVENCSVSSMENEEESLEVVLSACKPLTQAFLSFLQNVNSANGTVISPSLLFGQICKKLPQFRGYQQQDSHEFLCHFLDSLKTEEIERQKASILKLFNLTGKIDKNKVDEITKKKIKSLSPYASHTFVDAIFGGQLLSTVTCEECGHSSQIFEHFIDLSLPVAEEKPTRQNSQRLAVSENAGDDKAPHKKEGRKLSKHQELKMKRNAKRSAKKRGKTLERGRQKTCNEPQGQEESEGDQTEADVEDNIEETESVKSPKDDITQLNNSSATEEVVDSALPEEANINENISGSDSGNDDVGTSMEHFASLTLTNDNDDHQMTTNESSREHTESVLDNKDFVDIRFCSKHITESKDSLPENEHGEDRCHEDSSSISNSPDKENVRLVGTSTDSGISNGESDRVSGCGQNSVRKVSQRTLGPRYQSSSHECSILSCLNQYTAPELLTGNNKFGCESCSQKRHESAGKSSEEKPKIAYTNASKQLLIFSPPAILVLHLKRFQQIGMTLKKVNRHVNFPLSLDIAPFCSSDTQGLPLLKNGQKEILYSLYGVVEHSGRLKGGHYTAYVKVRNSIASTTKLHLKQEPTDFSKLKLDLNNLNESMSESNEAFSKTDLPEGQWYYISDSHVSVSSEESVLRSQGYLLFYERMY